MFLPRDCVARARTKGLLCLSQTLVLDSFVPYSQFSRIQLARVQREGLKSQRHCSWQPQTTCKKLSNTANVHTKILGFRGFDSSRISISRGGILLSAGNFPEMLSPRTLAWIIDPSRESGRGHWYAAKAVRAGLLELQNAAASAGRGIRGFVRGNHLSNTTCLKQVFLNRGEWSSKV